jgi:ADP-ribose pyrophosphatase YjhB (NUDIX family)
MTAGVFPLICPAADPPAAAALIVTPAGDYLLQHRDNIPGIWFPDYWGLFGGLIDDGETPEQAIRRELQEELGFSPDNLRYFTQVGFDFRRWGGGLKVRYIFEVVVAPDQPAGMVLSEGQGMALHPGHGVMGLNKLAPYDALAIGLHLAVSGAVGDAGAGKSDTGGPERPAVFP